MRKYLVLTTIWILALIPMPIKAQGTGLSVSPVTFELNMQPGAEKVETISVTNNTTETMQLELSVVELGYDNGVYVSRTDSPNVSNLKLDRSSLTLKPSENVLLSARVTIPANQTLGTFKLAANLRWKQADAGSDITAGAVSPELSVLFSINVLTQLPKTAVQVTKLEVPGLMITNSTTISYEIKNNAPYFTKPLAYLQLVNPRGKPVWRQVINESGALLDSGATLSGQAKAEFEFNNPLDMGQYKVQLLIVDTQLATQDILTGTTLFIHWFALILGAIGFIVLFWGANKLRKKYLVSAKPKFK